MSEMSISWGEIANLTHKTQVEQFNFCSCEEQEYFPYEDCPKKECDCDNLDQDVSGYTCYKCYKKGA